MRNLGRLIVQMSSGLVSYGRVMEVIKEEREPLTEGAYRRRARCGARSSFGMFRLNMMRRPPCCTKSHSVVSRGRWWPC